MTSSPPEMKTRRIDDRRVLATYVDGQTSHEYMVIAPVSTETGSKKAKRRAQVVVRGMVSGTVNDIAQKISDLIVTESKQKQGARRPAATPQGGPIFKVAIEFDDGDVLGKLINIDVPDGILIEILLRR